MAMFKSNFLWLMRILLSDPSYFVSASAKRIKAKFLIDYFFSRNGFAFWPVVIEYEVTHHCNLNCIMCDLYGGSPMETSRSQRFSKEQLMSQEEFKDFIDDVATFKPAIIFTGGEPLLRKEIISMISYTKKRGLLARLVTNGTLLLDRAEDLVSTRIDNIIISIDGPQPIHDEMRGRSGTFEKAEAGMRKIIESKKKHGVTHPRMDVSFTVTGRNYKHLTAMLDVAKSLSAERLIYQHLWFWDEAIVQKHNSTKGHLAKATVQNIKGLEGLDVSGLIEEIRRVRQLAGNMAIRFIPDLSSTQINVYYQNPTEFLKKRCFFPWRAALIMPNGNLIACMDYLVGDVRREKFSQLWNSPRYRKFRRALQKEHVFPLCARCCGLFTF